MPVKTGTLVSAGAAAMVLIALFAVAHYVLLPQRLAVALADAVQRQTGLGLAVTGPAALSFSRGMEASLTDVRLSSPRLAGGLQIQARRVSLPMTVANLAGGLPVLPAVLAEGAYITLDLGGDLRNAAPEAGKVSLETPPPEPAPLRIRLADSAFGLIDSRSGFSARFDDVNGLIERNEGGGLRLHLAGLLNGVHSTIHLEADQAGRMSNGTPADMVLSSDSGELQFSGRLAWRDEFALDGRLFAASRNSADFLAWLGLPSALAPAGAFEMEGAFSSAGAAAHLASFALAYGATNATGKLSLARQKEGLALDGAIEAAELVLPSFWRTTAASDGWNSTVFAWQPLPDMKGRLQLRAKTLTLQGWPLSGAQAEISFEGQGLRLNASAGGDTDGGSAEMALSLDGDGTPGMTIALKLDDVAAASALPALAGLTWLDGTMDLDVEASATGDNLAALAATLAGKFALDLRQGRLPGYSVRDLLSDAGKGWRAAQGDSTSGLSVAAEGDIADGILALQSARLKAEGLDVSIDGEIDLLRQALDLRIDNAGTRELPSSLAVTGSWYGPDFGAATAQSGGTPQPAGAAPN